MDRRDSLPWGDSSAAASLRSDGLPRLRMVKGRCPRGLCAAIMGGRAGLP